jgi:hypothetical protein
MALNIDGLVEFKDVGASRFDGRIARPIRTENDVLAWHTTPPHLSFADLPFLVVTANVALVLPVLTASLIPVRMAKD